MWPDRRRLQNQHNCNYKEVCFWYRGVLSFGTQELKSYRVKKIHVTITKTYLFIIAVVAVSPSSQYKKGFGLQVAPSAAGVISCVA
jgi:hypothetical protein